MITEQPLSEKEFHDIYAKVPRLTVEIVIKGPEGLYLTKRNIEPCKGQWHIPGGTVYFGESLLAAVKRIAKRELDIQVSRAEMLGYIEYLSHYLNGLDSPLGLVFVIKSYKGTIKLSEESQKSGWFKKMPQNMHADQDKFLLKHKLISENKK